MELRRLEMDSVLLLRDARVDEKLVASSGNMISDVWIVFDIVDIVMTMIVVEVKFFESLVRPKTDQSAFVWND
jgi:hypothetical protein